MSDRTVFKHLYDLCVDLETHNADVVDRDQYGVLFAAGFEHLRSLVKAVQDIDPDFSAASLDEARAFVEYYTNPPKGALVDDDDIPF